MTTTDRSSGVISLEDARLVRARRDRALDNLRAEHATDFREQIANVRVKLDAVVDWAFVATRGDDEAFDEVDALRNEVEAYLDRLLDPSFLDALGAPPVAVDLNDIRKTGLRRPPSALERKQREFEEIVRRLQLKTGSLGNWAEIGGDGELADVEVERLCNELAVRIDLLWPFGGGATRPTTIRRAHRASSPTPPSATHG
jgi:hypothetical protein